MHAQKANDSTEWLRQKIRETKKQWLDTIRTTEVESTEVSTAHRKRDGVPSNSGDIIAISILCEGSFAYQLKLVNKIMQTIFVRTKT
jgi:hypothetical protein